MMATTVVSYFYYFEFIRQMYFRPSPRGEKLAIPGLTAAVILLAVLGTVGLGDFSAKCPPVPGRNPMGQRLCPDGSDPVKKNPALYGGVFFTVR